MFGIILFFAIPMTRKLPIGCASFVGRRTSKYRWFAVAYILTMFFVMPLAVLGIGIGSEIALIGEFYFGDRSFEIVIQLSVVACVTVALVIFITTVNYIREKRPKILPKFLQSWKWLPAPLRSLKEGFKFKHTKVQIQN